MKSAYKQNVAILQLTLQVDLPNASNYYLFSTCFTTEMDDAHIIARFHLIKSKGMATKQVPEILKETWFHPVELPNQLL